MSKNVLNLVYFWVFKNILSDPPRHIPIEVPLRGGGDRRNSNVPIETVTLCHDAQVVGPYWVSSTLRQTVLAVSQRITPVRHKTLMGGGTRILG